MFAMLFRALTGRVRRTTRNPGRAHPDPDVEEFARWLTRADHKIRPSYGRDEIGYWRAVAARAAAAGFLRRDDCGCDPATWQD